jgi:CelD/BcsL family acetyltransferase involved in cellulose biosynthesis
MTDALSVSFIRDEARLAALAPQWWGLWQRVPEATPFQSPAWLIPWWRAFKPGALLGLSVRMGHRLVGLALFYIEAGEGGERLLPVGTSISDYLDVLVDPAVRHPVLAVIANAYSRCPERWVEWELTELAPGASSLHMPAPSGCVEGVGTSAVCPVLALPDEKVPTAAVPASMQRWLRATRRRIDGHGEMQVLSTADRAPEWWIAELWRLHTARWTSLGEPGLLRDARLKVFHQGAVPRLAARKLLRLYALVLGGSVAGIYYGFQHGDCAFAYLSGFDPEFAYYSPGTFLMGHAIAQAAAEGAREFHFLRGGETYKHAWGAIDRWNTRRALWRSVT